MSYKSVTQELYNKTCFLYNKTCFLSQIPLRTTNIVDYDMQAVHESNDPFPVKRH